jgi:hypothetical protein
VFLAGNLSVPLLGRIILYFYFIRCSDELIAPTMHGFDNGLAFSIVADSFTCSFDLITQGSVGNYLAGPDVFEEFIAGDELFPMCDQIFQKVKYLWLELDHDAVISKLVVPGIDFVFTKLINHRHTSLPGLVERSLYEFTQVESEISRNHYQIVISPFIFLQVCFGNLVQNFPY